MNQGVLRYTRLYLVSTVQHLVSLRVFAESVVSMAFMHTVSSIIVTTSRLLVFPDVAILSFLWYSPKERIRRSKYDELLTVS